MKLKKEVGASEIASTRERFLYILDLCEKADEIKDFFHGEIVTEVTPEWKRASAILKDLEKLKDKAKWEFYDLMEAS